MERKVNIVHNESFSLYYHQCISHPVAISCSFCTLTPLLFVYYLMLKYSAFQSDIFCLLVFNMNLFTCKDFFPMCNYLNLPFFQATR